MAVVVGCSETPKGAVPAENPAVKPPSTTVTNPDGTETQTGGIGVAPNVE
jgi:hypothetical protein